MASKSTLQLLPRHILEMISYYTMYIRAGDEHAHLASTKSMYAHRADLFYSLCPEWTEVALEHYFRNFVLRLNSQSGHVTASHSFESLGISIKDARKAIKCVKLCMSLIDLMSGKAALILAQWQYSLQEFPHARKVQLVFDASYINNSPLDDSDMAKVPRFYRQVLNMFPNVCAIGVENYSGESVKNIETSCDFQQCMMKLCADYNGMRVDLSRSINIPWSIANMHSTITYICLIDAKYSAKTYSVLHKSAGSLQSLMMATYRPIDAVRLFTDANGKPVTYHRLKVLRLLHMTSGRRLADADAPTSLSLPSLAHLVVKNGYPFNDDVLFRSCRKSLEHVSISTEPSTLAILNQFKVFRGKDYPRLHSVNLLNKGEDIVDGHPAYSSFVSKIAHNINCLSVEDEVTIDKFASGIIQGSPMQTIQHLDIAKAKLSFSSLCVLIKQLPRMTQLRFGQISLDKEYQDMSMQDLHDNAISKWKSISSCLQYCQIIHRGADLVVGDLARCGILLSILCPRFTRLVVDSSAYEQFNAAIDKAIKEEPFSKYEQRLSLLSFNEAGLTNFPRAS